MQSLISEKIQGCNFFSSPTGVPAVHHERVDETLHDGALRLAEPLGGIPSQKNRIVENVGKKEKIRFQKETNFSGFIIFVADVKKSGSVLKLDVSFVSFVRV